MRNTTLADRDSILKRLYDDDPDVWAFAQADAIALIEKQGDTLDALNTKMPCGHLARYQVQEKDTQYCALCEVSGLRKEIKFLENEQ